MSKEYILIAGVFRGAETVKGFARRLLTSSALSGIMYGFGKFWRIWLGKTVNRPSKFVVWQITLSFLGI